MNIRPRSQVFDLYTSRAMLTASLSTEEILQRIIGSSGTSSSTQLGLVDDKRDVITLQFPANADGRHDPSENRVEISIAQDLIGLRNRKGDTGERPKFALQTQVSFLKGGGLWRARYVILLTP